MCACVAKVCACVLCTCVDVPVEGIVEMIYSVLERLHWIRAAQTLAWASTGIVQAPAKGVVDRELFLRDILASSVR